MIGRRGLMGGVMAAWGGVGPRRIDQRVPSESRAGSGPAPGNSVVVARRVIVVGTSDGVFVYNSSGVLIASMAAQAGSDAAGNTWGVGVEVQLTPTQHVQMHGAGIDFANGDFAPSTITEVGNGIWSLVGGLKTSTDAAALIELISKQAGGTAGPGVIIDQRGASVSRLTNGLLEVHGTVVADGGVWALAATPSGSPPAGAETFSSLGSTGLAGDAGNADYRFTAEGELQLAIHKSFNALGGITTATFANVLPAAYIPSASRLTGGDPISINGAALGNSTRLTITGATGAVNLVNLPAGTTAVGCDVRIPLA